MEKITIIIHGQEYNGRMDLPWPVYLSDIIQEVLEWQVKPKLHYKNWLWSDGAGGTNYHIHDMIGNPINPFIISMRVYPERPELRRIFVNAPIGHNG